MARRIRLITDSRAIRAIERWDPGHISDVLSGAAAEPRVLGGRTAGQRAATVAEYATAITVDHLPAMSQWKMAWQALGRNHHLAPNVADAFGRTALQDLIRGGRFHDGGGIILRRFAGRGQLTTNSDTVRAAFAHLDCVTAANPDDVWPLISQAEWLVALRDLSATDFERVALPIARAGVARGVLEEIVRHPAAGPPIWAAVVDQATRAPDALSAVAKNARARRDPEIRARLLALDRPEVLIPLATDAPVAEFTAIAERLAGDVKAGEALVRHPKVRYRRDLSAEALTPLLGAASQNARIIALEMVGRLAPQGIANDRVAD